MRGLLKQFGGLAAARGLNALAQATLLILLARGVGPYTFGIIAVLFSIHALLMVVAGLNSHTFVARELTLGHSGSARAAMSVNRLTLGIAFAASCAVSLAVRDEPLVLYGTLANAAALFVEGRTEVRLAIAFARQEVRPAILATGGRALLSIALYVALVAFGIQILVAYAVARITAAVVGYCAALLLARPSWSEQADALFATFKAQIPLATALAMGALRNLDNLVVTVAAGPTATGVYAAASKALGPFTVIPAAMTSLIVPRAVRASRRVLRTYIDRSFVAGLALSSSTLVLVPVSERVVTALFGPEFAGGGTVLSLVLLRVGIVCFSPVLATMLQAQRLDRYVAVNATIVTATLLPSIAIGAVVAGAVGAAAAYAGVSILGFTRMWMVGRRKIASET